MKILIAEDDLVSRILLKSVLNSEAGWSVIESVNGLEAWDLLDQGLRPDVCVLDVMMPGLDGIELIRKIRNDERFRGLRVVLCSTLNDRNIIKQAAALSVSGYLLKPISRNNVLEQLRKVQTQVANEIGMEPATIVCERLGITHDLYLELMNTMPDEVIASVNGIRQSIRSGQMLTAFARISALRSAAVNLGITSIGEKTAHAETLLTPETAKVIDNQQDPVEREKRLKNWNDSQGKQMEESLDRVTKEGQKLQHWIESRRESAVKQETAPVA